MVGKELPLSSWEEKSLGRMGVSLEKEGKEKFGEKNEQELLKS